MKHFKYFYFNLFVLLALLNFAAFSANAQTTTFTYQGRLSDGATAANGTYDLGFALFDAASGGTQIGSPLTRPAVTVTNGTFTVSLDFGAAAFPGANRFLQIAVKKQSDANFTTLAPRQPISSTPYAIRALNAGTADTATTATSATTAATATNAEQLGGVAAANYLQKSGSGANLTDLNASSVSSGTLSDAALSANVARRDTANTFTGDQTINGSLAQTGTLTDLNLTNGFVARGTVGAGAIPATGGGARMMFYPGKAAFRAGRVFYDNISNPTYPIDGTSYWDDANVGSGSAAFNSNNRASGANSFAAGFNAQAAGERSFAFNGMASGVGAIALGTGSEATGEDSLALGPSGRAYGIGSTTIGPSIAAGNFAVAIGLQNRAMGDFSVAIGKNAYTCSTYNCAPGSEKKGAIVISDACGTFYVDTVTASANNQVNIRGCGGFRFFTGLATPETGYNGSVSGVSLAPGGSQWLSLSDRNSKENFKSVNARDVLQKVLKLPITTWNYKSQDASIRHIGAMAQDFKAAFEIGEDDKHISALDPDGVAFAAIQGLNEEMTEQLSRQNRLIAAQQALLVKLETRLSHLEQKRAVRRRAVKRNK